MAKVAILQSNYIPWIGYFKIIKEVDIFVIYDEVQYTKNDWRNRNRIKTKGGIKWLTIPVKQTELKQKIFDTEVVNQTWRRKHLNAIKLNYCKSKYYNQHIDFISELYSGNETFLSEINTRFIKNICNLLNINTTIIDSRELNLKGNRNEKLVDACLKLNANTYLSGRAAESYLDCELFSNKGITIEWVDYSTLSEYQQLYPPFVMSVSIIDLIMNSIDLNTLNG